LANGLWQEEGSKFLPFVCCMLLFNSSY